MRPAPDGDGPSRGGRSLLQPGSPRAGDLFEDGHVLRCLIEVEQAWLDTVHEAGLAGASTDLSSLVDDGDLDRLAGATEAAGNPVVPLVRLLRERVVASGGAVDASWVHRGLTSQDVLDTALVLCVARAGRTVLGQLDAQVHACARLAAAHRGDVRVGRTLGQPAVPTTFGLVVAGWLHGALDAHEAVQDALVRLPVQVGGAAGTLALVVASCGATPGPEAVAEGLVSATAARLGLQDSPPWHTRRRPLLRAAEAFVGCTDLWGVVAGDVVLASRPEVAELAEPSAAGRGASSTMPHKQNPVLSVLVRAAALRTPPLLATLHAAAADAVEQRPPGAWHAEWDTLATLARTTVVAGSQTTEVLTGLRVDAARMRRTAEALAPDLLAEAGTVTSAGLPPGTARPARVDHYLGAADLLVDRALARADSHGERMAAGGSPGPST